MADHVFVPDLARELGVKIADVLRTAQQLGLPVRRGAARLTPTQVRQLREAYKQKTAVRRPLPPPPVRYERLRTSRCECCRLGFQHKDGEVESLCDQCADHYEVDGEESDRTMARLRSHAELFEQRYEKVAVLTGDYHKRMKAALESRDKWKRMVIEIALGHEAVNGGCCCGAPVYPCGTRRQVEMSNFGIYRQIEQFESMHHDELLDVLYGDPDAIPDWE